MTKLLIGLLLAMASGCASDAYLIQVRVSTEQGYMYLPLVIGGRARTAGEETATRGLEQTVVKWEKLSTAEARAK